MNGLALSDSWRMAAEYAAFSPARLAYALGYRIDLRGQGNGLRDVYLVKAGQKPRAVSHARACAGLSRLARRKGIGPEAIPSEAETPRALINGQERAERQANGRWRAPSGLPTDSGYFVAYGATEAEALAERARIERNQA